MKGFFKTVLIIDAITIPAVLLAWFFLAGHRELETLGDWYILTGIGVFLFGLTVAASEQRGAAQYMQQYEHSAYTSEYANRPVGLRVPLRTVGLFTVASAVLVAIAVVVLFFSAQKKPNHAVEPTRALSGASGSP